MLLAWLINGLRHSGSLWNSAANVSYCSGWRFYSCLCLWATYSSSIEELSFWLLHVLQSFRWRIFWEVFCKSECIWQITFVDVFVNWTAILLEGFAFKSFIDFFPNILYLCRCLLALFFVITSINLSADVSFTLCECTVPWVPLGSFCKLVSDFPLSNNHMLKWI